MRLLKTTPLPSLAIYARDAQPRSQRQLLELFAVARRCVGFPARGSPEQGRALAHDCPCAGVHTRGARGCFFTCSNSPQTTWLLRSYSFTHDSALNTGTCRISVPRIRSQERFVIRGYSHLTGICRLAAGTRVTSDGRDLRARHDPPGTYEGNREPAAHGKSGSLLQGLPPPRTLGFRQHLQAALPPPVEASSPIVCLCNKRHQRDNLFEPHFSAPSYSETLPKRCL